MENCVVHDWQGLINIGKLKENFVTETLFGGDSA